jgi:DNA-binding response OmpR family regulator
MPYLCLIVSRDRAFAATLAQDLPPFGFKPFFVDGGESACAMLKQWRFEAIVVDAEGLGAACRSILRHLQGSARVPLMLLSCTADEQEQIECLQCGATEVVAKPASARLIAAKLRRLVEIGLMSASEPSELHVGALVMDARHGSATIEGLPLELTTHQFDLLFLLAARAGQFVRRETIASALRGPVKEIGRSADVHVYRIRRKLRELGVESLRLDTVHGRGYCLSVKVDDAAGNDAPAVRYPEWSL